MTHHIIRDEQELTRLHRNGDGFIYNDFSGLGPAGGRYNILHVAGCRWVRKSNTNVPKLFFETLEAAKSWLSIIRGEQGVNWKLCGTCCSETTDARVKRERRRQDPSAELNDLISRKNPFYERRVEEIVITWMEAKGFSVQKQVRVSNGIIDLVATKGVEEWLIEAKGEDRGGYNSAEMNFRIGISQLCSRTTDRKGKLFALAIPLTPHFRRVLIKHMSFGVFERMEFWLFVVNVEGDVIAVSPIEVQGFVDCLCE